MDKKLDVSKLHDTVKEIQNKNWKAYVDFVKSGDMAKYNQDMSEIVSDICSSSDKDISKIAKEANDFFVCGWSIIVNKIMDTKRGD